MQQKQTKKGRWLSFTVMHTYMGLPLGMSQKVKLIQNVAVCVLVEMDEINK